MLPSCKTLESWEILGKKFVLSHIFFPPKHYPAHQERQPGPTLLRRQFYEATFLNAHSGGTVFCGLGTVLRWELHRNCVKFPHMNKYNLSSLQGSLAFFFLGEICGFLRSHRFTISSGKFPSDFLIEKSSEFWTWFFPATCYFSLGGGYQKTYFSASACSQNCFLKSPKLFLEKNCSRMPKIKFVFVYSFACSFAFFLHCFFSYRAFSRVHVSSPVVCAFPPLPPPHRWSMASTNACVSGVCRSTTRSASAGGSGTKRCLRVCLHRFLEEAWGFWEGNGTVWAVKSLSTT